MYLLKMVSDNSPYKFYEHWDQVKDYFFRNPDHLNTILSVHHVTTEPVDQSKVATLVPKVRCINPA